MGIEETIFTSASNRKVGLKKYYVFHLGEAPDSGIKTNWIMQEYRLSDSGSSSGGSSSSSSNSRSSKRRERSKTVSTTVYTILHSYPTKACVIKEGCFMDRNNCFLMINFY